MNVKVGLIGVFDMLKFKNLRKNRAEMIASAEAKPLPGTYRVNELAKRLHLAEMQTMFSPRGRTPM